MPLLDVPGELCAHFYEVETPPDVTLLATTADRLRRSLGGLECDDLEEDVAQALIRSAQLQAQDYAGIVLFKTTFKLSLPFFPLRIELRKRPVISVTSVSRRVDGVDTAVDAEDYRLIQRDCYPYISLSDGACWPTDADMEDDAVSVIFDAGLSDKEEGIPVDIKAAINATAVHDFENPGDCDTEDMLPGIAKKILKSHRCLRV
ncbi:MAG: hypothetical protein V3U60_16750 [Gammaproteobacteria bacterium]